MTDFNLRPARFFRKFHIALCLALASTLSYAVDDRLGDSNTFTAPGYPAGSLQRLGGQTAQGGQAEEGLRVIAEALAMVEKNGERWNEAELYRIKGELTLQQSRASLGQVSGKSQTGQEQSETPKSQILNPQCPAEAEACFLKAIAIAQKQQAKSWELRAATSLARLWQQQNKHADAHQLLAEVYNRFTEGFETRDLLDAKALIDELLSVR